MRVLGEELHRVPVSRSSSKIAPAAGNIGALPNAQPDGYTICIINRSMIYNQYLFKSLTFDPDKSRRLLICFT